MDQPVSAAIPDMSRLRERVHQLVNGAGFNRAMLCVILLNAVLLGMDADPRSPASWRGLLAIADALITGLFVLEMGLKLFACRREFFRSGWNVFDLGVVLISLAPAAGAFSILRSLRVFRLFRMFSLVPALRRVVDALFKAIPGMGAILAVLALLFYVASVMATSMFGRDGELSSLFGTVEASAFTLFQVMTLDGWSSEIVREVMNDDRPWAWLFFIPFIVLTSFAVLNMFIAVIVESLQAEQDQQMRDVVEEIEQEFVEADRRADGDREVLLDAITALRAEVASLRNEVREQIPAK